MTADCLRLDAYLDGQLSAADAEAFETHALDCEACDDALDTTLDLSPLRDDVCPPAVLEAALRTARRRAPDRPAVARPRVLRFRFPAAAALALAAALAVAIGVAPWGPEAPAPEPIAEAVVPPADGSDPIAATDPPEPAPPPVEPAPAPEPRRVAAPQPAAPPTPTPEPPIAEAPAPDLIAEAAPEAAEPEPTPEDVAEAQRDLALAFHLVAEAHTQAGRAVRDRATPVSHTLDHALPF